MTEKKRPNILLIAIDDGFAFWRYRTAFGAELQTPNIDRMVAASTLFKSAYCQIPVCGPSRASTMSGLSPYETGVLDNYKSIFEQLRPEQMWQYKLKRSGYHCSTAGKVHHGFKPLSDDLHSVLYSHPSSQVYFGPAKDSPSVAFGGLSGGHGTTDIKADKQYYDYRSSKHAINFLSSYDGESPFYREVGFHHPHLPFRTPIRFKEMYDIDAFKRPEEWDLGFDLSEFTARYMIANDRFEDPDFWRKSVRNYFSAYSHVDHHIGRVWDALKQSPHADNTIVVLFSDHGYHMGDKTRFRKFTLWEEAARVPLIVHDPSQDPREVDDPVALADIGPTILDYSCCAPLHSAVGSSLRGLVNGERDAERSVPTFWYGSASVRKGAYRTTIYQDGSSEFYDVEKDKWLSKNLANNHPDYAASKADLITTCHQYGLDVLEPGRLASRASNFQSLIKGAQTGSELPTLGLVSIGEVAPVHHRPGYRVQFSTLETNGTITLPPGISEFRFAADTNGGMEELKVVGNRQDNNIIFAGSHKRFVAEIHTGPGCNTITASHDALVVYCGSGKNHVVSGLADSRLYGGAGQQDVFECHAGNNQFYGGTGGATMIGGTGNDTFYCRYSDNTVVTGQGVNTVYLQGGTTRVDACGAEIEVHLSRTGLPQHLENFSVGRIDFSGWPLHLGSQVDTTENGLVITCGRERVTITGSRLARLRKIIQAALLGRSADEVIEVVEA